MRGRGQERKRCYKGGTHHQKMKRNSSLFKQMDSTLVSDLLEYGSSVRRNLNFGIVVANGQWMYVVGSLGYSFSRVDVNVVLWKQNED